MLDQSIGGENVSWTRAVACFTEINFKDVQIMVMRKDRME